MNITRLQCTAQHHTTLESNLLSPAVIVAVAKIYCLCFWEHSESGQQYSKGQEILCLNCTALLHTVFASEQLTNVDSYEERQEVVAFLAL